MRCENLNRIWNVRDNLLQTYFLLSASLLTLDLIQKFLNTYKWFVIYITFPNNMKLMRIKPKKTLNRIFTRQ